MNPLRRWIAIVTVLLSTSCGVYAEYIGTDSLQVFEPTELDLQLLDYSLAWIDTLPCTEEYAFSKQPDSVYIARLQELPYIIEMPYNAVVKGFIEAYLSRNHKQVARMRRLSESYFPIFEEHLLRYGLPTELKYLPVIESGLNPQAHSRAGAAGLWQFMPQTAKNNGLEVNSLIDERLDPYKSTDAACRFLKSLYNIYHDWNLAIAAYNCGPGNINKAVHRANGQRDFWQIYTFLPKETRAYLPLFIAANYVFNYADEHNICPAEPLLPLSLDTVAVNDRLHLQQVANLLDIPLNTLRKINPQYAMNILPGGKAYTLCLPAEKVGAFILNEPAILSYKRDSLINKRRDIIDLAQHSDLNGGYTVNGVTYYKIKRGDTLSAIAKKFHCSVTQLQKWNGLKNTSIREGKTLKILR